MTTQQARPWSPQRYVVELGVVLIAALIGCSSATKEEQPDCVEPPEGTPRPKKTVKIERFGLGRAGAEKDEDKDWCRACVMSKIGYASCQRVLALKPDEDRKSLRDRARIKACQDAKYPKDACPASAVINIQCKDEPAPAGTPDPGTALQNLYRAMGGALPEKSGDAGSVDKEQAAKPPTKATPAAEPSIGKKPVEPATSNPGIK